MDIPRPMFRLRLPVWLTRSDRRLRVGAATVLAAALAIVILAISARSYQTLQAGSPPQPVDALLSLETVGDAPLRYRVTTADPVSAQSALPPAAEMVSPLYDIHVRGQGQARLIFTPREADPAAWPDLYRWDTARRRWQFLPSQPDPENGRITVSLHRGRVALLQVHPTSSLLGAVIEAGSPIEGTPAGLLPALLVDAGQVQPGGVLEPMEMSLPPGEHQTIFPVIRFSGSQALSALLAQPEARRALIRYASQLAAGPGMGAVVLEAGPLEAASADAYHRLIGDAAGAVRSTGGLLAVRVPMPVGIDGRGTEGYDWERLGAQADLIVVTPPGSPEDYSSDGSVARFLAWATGRVSRTQLVLVTSALPVDEWGDRTEPIAYDYALSALGSVALESPPAGAPPASAETLTFGLNGIAAGFGQAPGTGLPYYTVYTGDGIHTIWLVAAPSLRQRLDWLAGYRLGGVMLEGLESGGAAPGVDAMLTALLAQQSSGGPGPALQLRWQVTDASGAVLAETSVLPGQKLIWDPPGAGQYTIRGSLTGQVTADLGAVQIAVEEGEPAAVPDAEAVVAGVPVLSADRPTPAPPLEGMPPPVVPAGAVGNFELGGQVNHVINDPGRMREAGMTWVKFQLAWAEDMDARVAWNLVEQGRRHGFKVLLSIPGRTNYPAEINIEKYLDFLRGVAYYGPDAIEVWNEQNIDYEWPRGQINGEYYTREMLAPAYNAIKEINPNIMVISGALAPTGAFFAEGGCSATGSGCDDWLYLQQMAQAGAASYMDCVGVHYNAGATAPSATTGHPADPGYQHYSWYYGSMLQLYGGTFGRPVCFTELGYLSGEGLGNVPGRFGWAADNSVAEQAAWLAESVQMSRQSGLVRLLIVWNFDFTYWGDDPMAGYAIVRPGGGCPACDALDSVMP